MNRILKCRKGRINNTWIVGNTFIKTATRTESSRRLRLKRERWSLLIAEERGVNVPKIIDYYIDDENCEVLELEVIHARRLTMFPVESQVKVMRKVGSEILKLKSVAEKFGWPHPDSLEGEFDNWELFLYEFVKLYSERLIRQHVLQENYIIDLLKRISCFSFDIQNADLVHRDIKPNNILCTEDLAKYWIVDWENSLLGDQVFDLATYSANYGRDCLWEGLVDGFGNSTITSEKYKLYEVITLIGTIDFYRKRGINYSRKLKKLEKLLL